MVTQGVNAFVPTSLFTAQCKDKSIYVDNICCNHKQTTVCSHWKISPKFFYVYPYFIIYFKEKFATVFPFSFLVLSVDIMPRSEKTLKANTS
jgi:hypothetical protein